MSAVLAFCMLLSGTVSAFAAEPTYTARYDKKASKEVYSKILDDMDKLLENAAFTGNTMQELWKIVPGLSGVLEGTDSADFYADALDHLADYMSENAMESVSAEVLDAYFAENPIIIESPAAFADSLKTFVSTLLTKGSMVMLGGTGLYSVLLTVIAFGSDGGMNEELLDSLFSSLDHICSALGIEQEQTFEEAFDLIDQSPEAPQNVANYVNNIIDALIPNTVDNAIAMIQNVMTPENNALLYKGVSDLFTSLDTVLTNVEPILSGFGFDLGSIKDIFAKIKDYVVAIPTNDSGEIMWNDAVAYLVNDVVLPELANINLDIIGFGSDTTAFLKFAELNPANLENAADTTDALNVIFHYLYDNLVANSAMIEFAISSVLPGAGITLPAEVTDLLDSILSAETESDAVWNIYSTLEVALGNEEPVYNDPDKPADPNPSDPTDPSKPGDDDDKPSDKPSDTQKPSDTKAPQTAGKNTANPNLPNTGAQEMTALFVIIPVTAAGLFLIVAALRKKAFGK